MHSSDRQTDGRLGALIAGIAFTQAIATVLIVIVSHLAGQSVARALAQLAYALVIAALGFGLFRWHRPVFPAVLALLVLVTNADHIRRGAYAGLIPAAVYLIAYAIGVALTWHPRRAGTSASR